MYLNAKILKILPWWQNLRWVLSHIYKFNPTSPKPDWKIRVRIILKLYVTQANSSGGGSVVGALDKILLELKRWIKLSWKIATLQGLFEYIIAEIMANLDLRC